VSLTLERQRSDGSLREVVRTVKRERPEDAPAVPTSFMLDGGVGYVRVTTFASDGAAGEVRTALTQLERAGMRRLLLDLRDNGGGSVDEAKRVAGEFLPAGTVVYTAEGRKSEVNRTGRVDRSFWRSERRYPIVVLVNHGTASAAELVAGALQDHDRALIVGRQTFGKSLMTSGFPLSDGSMMVLVVGHIKTPCGRTIQREYREVSERAYYRLARAERDTVGRPSCRTAAGRVVYGGGGIYPDVVLEDRKPSPLWLEDVFEADLPLRWVGGYLSDTPRAFTTVEALAARPDAPAGMLAAFRSFALGQGVEIPEGVAADSVLQRVLLLRAASTLWGPQGFYRVAAVLDPQVREAAAAFELAERVLSVRDP
jgi:carboxyl-terminal processing protease